MKSARIPFFVFMLVVTGQSAVDIYLPAFPSMMRFFHVTSGMIQLTLSFFLIGYAVSQLIYGPLSDHYGRRPALLFGLSLFVISSLLCVICESIHTLLFLRLLQGLGAGTANVHQRALVRDVFSGKELNKNTSYVAAVWALVPLVAPVVGGFIQMYFNWKTIFFFLTFVGMVLLYLIYKKLPETRIIYVSSTLTFKKVINDYKNILVNEMFLANALCCALLNCIFQVVNVSAPFLLQNDLKLSPINYACMMMYSAGGFFLGSMINSYVSQLFAVHKVILFGFFIVILSNVVMLFFFYNPIFSAISFILPVCILFFGIGLIYANCASAAFYPMAKCAGSAGAVFGFLVCLIGGLAGAVVSSFPVNIMVFDSIILILSCISSWFYFFITRNKRLILDISPK